MCLRPTGATKGVWGRAPSSDADRVPATGEIQGGARPVACRSGLRRRLAALGHRHVGPTVIIRIVVRFFFFATALSSRKKKRNSLIWLRLALCCPLWCFLLKQDSTLCCAAQGSQYRDSIGFLCVKNQLDKPEESNDFHFDTVLYRKINYLMQPTEPVFPIYIKSIRFRK